MLKACLCKGHADKWLCAPTPTFQIRLKQPTPKFQPKSTIRKFRVQHAVFYAALEIVRASNLFVVEAKHWEVLGLQPGASSREVTTAYRRLSRQHHPDKAGNSEEANRVMGELAAANAAIQSSLDTDLEIGEFLD